MAYDSRSIVLGSHGEDMQLIELGHLLQEVSQVWPQAAVVDSSVTRQAELKHILRVVRKKSE